MKKYIFLLAVFSFSLSLFSQQSIPLGKGSYAEYPPESVWDEDGYFAKEYRWFKDNWQNLYLHDNVRNRPLPTNDWWTNYVFSQYGGEAWAYPHAVSANNEGINIMIPNGFQGGGMITTPLLKVKGTTSLQSNEESVIFADFESPDYPEGWTIVGTAPYPGPVTLQDVDQSPEPNGFTGERFMNTYKGNEATVTFISNSFVIEKDYIRLLVGGGDYIDETYVGLFIDGIRVFAETGQNSGTLTSRLWDVTSYKGKTAEIRIVDNSTGGWGFIMCDEIIFTNSTFGGSGYANDFTPANSNVYDWTDLGFTFRCEDNNNRYMDVTSVHGIPYVWLEFKDIVPIITPEKTAAVYTVAGQLVDEYPVQLSVFAMEFGDRIYGVHVPEGSILHKSKGEDFQIELPASHKFVVVSALPTKELLGTYDLYARNKPENTLFNWEYRINEGKVATSFRIETKNLQTGQTGGETLMSFLPHHYRTTTKNFNFISGADYRNILGTMHTAPGSEFTVAYFFGGMPPYLPEPLDLTDMQRNRLNTMISNVANSSGGYNGNTYAKGLGEQSNMMLMAKSMDNQGFETLKTNLKTELEDWFTFDASEATKKQYFFAEYPDYGAIIGFPPGYGSQGFNDLHFHNGYFTMGAARLMMVDKEFKRDFAEMAKLVTKSYANWKRYEETGGNYLPFLRTFDPYVGHSWAGGTGDGGGNNQESTSEAIHSWFGIYLMGVELNDPEIISLGAMGYLLETTAANEYWMDMYEDNFSPTYTKDYVGILRTNDLAWATYFSGDPAWVLGIQAVPCDFFYQYLGQHPERTKTIFESMLYDRTTTYYDGKPFAENTNPYDNIRNMGAYLGGYHLNIMNNFDPVLSAQLTDDLYELGGEWTTHINMATNYYVSNATITYGLPAEGYHTSIASGAVYKNAEGELTYLLYNPTNAEVDVNIYKDGILIETVRVGAGKYYNSRIVGGQKPNVTITTYQDGNKMALNKEVKINATATDRDGSILWVEFYLDEELIGTSYAEPYQVTLKPETAGTKFLKAIATDNDGLKSDPYMVELEVLNIEQTPFNGTPWNVPTDKIRAVEFDEGGPEISCHDNEIEMQGGDNYRPGTGVETEGTASGDGNIGYTNTGEWFEYTMYVETTGMYELFVNLSSAGGGALQIDIDGEDMTGAVPVPDTGAWGNYTDVSLGKIPLKEGKHIMRVTVAKVGANLSSYKFTFLPGENMPPEVIVGETQIIYSPANTANLLAEGKAYGDATITAYQWEQTDSNTEVIISTPDQAATQVSGLENGTYQFKVTVTDTHGLTGSEQTVVVVRPANFPPVANPGNSRTVPYSEHVVLDGTHSFDPDGTIVKYVWEQVDTNTPVILEQLSVIDPLATASGFEPNKLYIFRLTVTDNENASTSENVRIFTEMPTGIGEALTPEITIYPNPFTDYLIIDLKESGKEFEKIKLYSVTGNVVLEENIRGRSSLQLNTSELKRGYYILVLSSDQQVISRKVIK
ncbi:MAG: carbohydrate-binding protein [Candidatus Azobacteroides sp.]|nr:carbohydrate-binding protein [Candidatus Azobacteroides sp.]